MSTEVKNRSATQQDNHADEGKPSAKPLKVLVIESGEGVGGSAFSMYRVVKYLDKARYAPHVYVYYDSAAFREIAEYGIPVTRLPLHRPFPHVMLENDTVLRRFRNFVSLYGNLLAETLSNGLRLARLIRRENYAIVHCNNGFFENFAAAFAARITRTPCVTHIRGTEPLMKIERVLHHWISKIIVLNQEMLRVYSEAFGAEKVRLIPNGVDLDLFQVNDAEQVRNEFSIGSDEFLIGTFARIVEGKGIPEFIDVAARAFAECKNLRFLVAGGGAKHDNSFELSMQARARDLGLGDRLIFTGWRDDIPDCMSATDLVLQISTTYPEGMSLAPIEAMALAKPVIVSDNPGYEGVIEDQQSGFLIPSGNLDALVRLVCELAQNREYAKKIGQNAHARFLSNFEYRIVVAQVQDVYRQALAA